MIASHKIIEDPTVGDLRYWRGANKSGFSIKHALRLMRAEPEENTHGAWDLIWRLPVQQRIRVCMWLALHNRLLCNANRLKRHLTTDPRCERCNRGEDETLLHLFRNCPIAQNIWKDMGGPSAYPSFYQGDLNLWIIKSIKAEGLIHSEKWITCFAVTMWWIWKWRNCAIFGRNEDIPVHTGSFLYSKIEEMWMAMNRDNDILPGALMRVRREIYVRWNFPPPNWFMMNTDGASKHPSGSAGGGGIIRDERGGFIKAFTANFGICSSYKAEMKATLIGLQMALDMGIHKMILQMDNETCVQVLLNKNMHVNEAYHITNACRRLLELGDWEIQVQHCY